MYISSSARYLRCTEEVREKLEIIYQLVSILPFNKEIVDDVACADGGEVDGGRIARAGVAFAAVNGALFEVAAERVGDDFDHEDLNEFLLSKNAGNNVKQQNDNKQ